MLTEEHAMLSFALQVRIDPSTSGLACEARIRNPPSACFYLNQHMTIDRILVGGQEVAFHRDPSRFLLEGVDTAVVVEAEVGDELVVSYAGALPPDSLPPMLAWVNKITPEIVELAYYAIWHPRFKEEGIPMFRLDVDLPADYAVTTNGVLEAETVSGDRRLTRWAASGAGFDIVLVASPHLQNVAERRDGMQAEIVFEKLPLDYVTNMKEHLIWALGRLADLYGPLPPQSYLRFVYSPRDGWGYSRAPMIVVSEDSALGQLDQPLGPAGDFRYAAHEMAHFWWSIADMGTPDDWINEGLAEFSAYRLAAELYGQAFAEHRLGEYRHNSAHRQTQTPIAETTHDSPDREVNRYDRATLLYIGAAERFGQEALDRLLRALYARFAGKGGATTSLFLGEVERHMGAEARAYFADGLCTPAPDLGID